MQQVTSLDRLGVDAGVVIAVLRLEKFYLRDFIRYVHRCPGVWQIGSRGQTLGIARIVRWWWWWRSVARDCTCAQLRVTLKGDTSGFAVATTKRPKAELASFWLGAQLLQVDPSTRAISGLEHCLAFAADATDRCHVERMSFGRWRFSTEI